MIEEYIRDGSRRKRGLLVAYKFKNLDTVFIGWSLCNKKDKFDPDRAVEIANGRALKSGSEISAKLIPSENRFPSFVNKALPNFINRCERYFRVPKDDIIVRAPEDPNKPVQCP